MRRYCENCDDGLAVAHGLCARCYGRKRRHGTTETVMTARRCPSCGLAFTVRRADQRFCSDPCRVRWHHALPGCPPPDLGEVRSVLHGDGSITHTGSLRTPK